MTEAEAFVASIRTRVGQIKLAQRTRSVESWGRIELACLKLIEAADSFERSFRTQAPEDVK